MLTNSRTKACTAYPASAGEREVGAATHPNSQLQTRSRMCSHRFRAFARQDRQARLVCPIHDCKCGSKPRETARVELGGARCRGAVAAGAAQDDVVAGDGVAGAAFDVVQRVLELVVGERLDLAAVVADEVVVMLAVGVDRLEARGAGADVDALDEAVSRQLLERRGRRSRSRRGAPRRGAGRRSPARSGSSPGGRAARSRRGGRRRLRCPFARSEASVASAQEL